MLGECHGHLGAVARRGGDQVRCGISGVRPNDVETLGAELAAQFTDDATRHPGVPTGDDDPSAARRCGRDLLGARRGLLADSRAPPWCSLPVVQPGSEYVSPPPWSRPLTGARCRQAATREGLASPTRNLGPEGPSLQICCAVR